MYREKVSYVDQKIGNSKKYENAVQCLPKVTLAGTKVGVSIF